MIDWALDATEIFNQIRAFEKTPERAYSSMGKKKIFIYKASVEYGSFSPPGVIFDSITGKGIIISTGCHNLLVEQLQVENQQLVQGDKILMSDLISINNKFSNF